jgi:hypothetical protein
MAVGTIWRHSRRYRTLLAHVGAGLQLLVELPFHLLGAWARQIDRRPRPAAVKAAGSLQPASEGPPESR